MRTFFADTFYWLALLNGGDEAHQAAVEFADNGHGAVITTLSRRGLWHC